MQTPDSQPGTSRASQACGVCRGRKRKCDKSIPKCGWCLSKGYHCEYGLLSRDGDSASSTWVQHAMFQENPGVPHPVTLPTIIFMDPTLLHASRIDGLQCYAQVPPAILQFIADFTVARDIAARFFGTIHKWMPIISKKRLYDHYLTPMYHSRPDITLLLLCMKIIMDTLPEESPNPQTPEYRAAKHSYLELQTAGVLSVQILQAGLLLALYELGHAIYPAAFLTIGACARYGYAIGINKGATMPVSKAMTMIEVEENSRVWWATVILDRFISVGCPGRPLATEQPGFHDSLPADDASWDIGIIERHDALLNMPSGSHMRKFALLCQAAGLLGQVLSHIATPVRDEQVHIEEAEQLERTMNSMITASESTDIEDYDQIAMIYSTLMTLQNFNLHPNLNSHRNGERKKKAEMALHELSTRFCICLPEKFPYLASNLENISPWGLYGAYQAAVTFLRVIQETGDPGAVETLKALKEMFEILRKRWYAAEVYLRLLEAREVMNMQ